MCHICVDVLYVQVNTPYTSRGYIVLQEGGVSLNDCGDKIICKDFSHVSFIKTQNNHFEAAVLHLVLLMIED